MGVLTSQRDSNSTKTEVKKNNEKPCKRPCLQGFFYIRSFSPFGLKRHSFCLQLTHN